MQRSHTQDQQDPDQDASDVQNPAEDAPDQDQEQVLGEDASDEQAPDEDADQDASQRTDVQVVNLVDMGRLSVRIVTLLNAFSMIPAEVLSADVAAREDFAVRIDAVYDDAHAHLDGLVTDLLEAIAPRPEARAPSPAQIAMSLHALGGWLSFVKSLSGGTPPGTPDGAPGGARPSPAQMAMAMAAMPSAVTVKDGYL